MKRTKTNKVSPSIPLANNMIRPSIFFIDKTKSKTNGIQIHRYGESLVITQGKLYEEDRTILLVLLEMSRMNKNQRFPFSLVDIARRKGVSNPYSETVLKPIRDSINRLFDAQIRIRPTREKGRSGRFVFAEGIMENDSGYISMGAFLDVVEDFVLGKTYINLDQYLPIRSSIARSLFLFLKSQRPFYAGEKGYDIRTSKLIEYLRYETSDRPYWQIIPHIKKAAEELKRKGLIKRFRYDPKRLKDNGGIWKFIAPEKALPEKTTGQKNDKTLDMILELMDDKNQGSQINETRWRSALNKLRDWLTENKWEDVDEILRKYCNWIRENGNIKFISPPLFEPASTFFQQFLERLDKNDFTPFDPNETPYWLKYLEKE